MKKFITLTTAAVLSAALLSGCGAGKTAMQIGDIKVTQGDIKFLADAYNTNIGDFDTAKDYAIQSFEDSMAAYNAMKQKGLELTEDEQKQLRQGMANLKSSHGGTSAFKKLVKEAGANEETIEIAIGQQLWQSKLSAELEASEPTEEETKAFFKENYLRAKHVLLLIEDEDEDFVKSRAEDILKRAQSGENFDELVTNFSEDPGSQSAPDGYVFTEKEMVKEFEEAVRSVQPNEFVMCKSSYGYHVIQRLPLDESDPKFNDFWEENKTLVPAKLQEKQLKDFIAKTNEEAGMTLEKSDEVIASIASPTAEPTDEPAETEADTKTE